MATRQGLHEGSGEMVNKVMVHGGKCWRPEL